MEAFILSAVEQGVMTITLNRPDRLNSFNDLMHHQLAECLKQAERDDGMSVERFYNPLVRRLAALPKPVICAVNGVAAGAGATLALGCDIVLAARSAKFVMAFSKLGLVPDCGGSWFLPRVAGRARAMGLALLGDSLSAEQAAQWGIIWQLVDDSELADTSLQLARHLAAQPTFGLGLIKKALLASETNSLDAQLDLERDYQRLAGRSDDYREGVSAFLAKRPPQFSGK
ncbi:enoyl-CoA hydratase-related protein [Klebsiella pneumoniae]|uniref:enoyl-CoA hydratase-related protein n=1 Tax=Klebsiella pneumoniae TaxID=573 RepID=UPI0015CA45D7|nr:enoyl-CoA hydratase-related protein [Klebsiella pneumoniae]